MPEYENVVKKMALPSKLTQKIPAIKSGEV